MDPRCGRTKTLLVLLWRQICGKENVEETCGGFFSSLSTVAKICRVEAREVLIRYA